RATTVLMALLYVGAAFAAGAQLAPKRFRYPLYILGLLILGAVMIWEGWYIRGHLLPGMTGVFLLGVAAFVGAVVRLVPNAPDQLRPDTSEDIAIAATLVARRFPPRFIRGG